MKNWMIRHWMFSYDSKVFGKVWRHYRVINTLVPLFLFAGLVNLFTEGFGFWDKVVFVPFFLLFFGKFLFSSEKVPFHALDWEQRRQCLGRKKAAGKNYNESLFMALNVRWHEKYQGKEWFVESWRFFFPLACIVLALLIYWIFGSPEEGFYEQRFF